MAADRTKFRSHQLTVLARSIVRLHGRDPLGFTATETYDSVVCVRGPGATAYYPREAWTTKFTRHLVRGFFTPSAVDARVGVSAEEH